MTIEISSQISKQARDNLDFMPTFEIMLASLDRSNHIVNAIVTQCVRVYVSRTALLICRHS